MRTPAVVYSLQVRVAPTLHGLRLSAIEMYGLREVQMLPAGDRRWKITDVVGAEDGLGVECLSGSGAIASIYARAFKEGFTLTLVSGRTVGIGAYLARLGRRCADWASSTAWGQAGPI